MISEDSSQDYVCKLLNCCYNRNFIESGEVLVGQALSRNTGNAGKGKSLP